MDRPVGADVGVHRGPMRDRPSLGPGTLSRPMAVPAITAAQVATWAVLAATLVAGAFVRLHMLGAVGLNTDEAVYVGQAAAILDDPALEPYFPLFRAHPLLYQFVLAAAFAMTGGVTDVMARTVSVAVGVVTVWLVFLLGRLLYGTGAGLIAAVLIAFMPYHVIVTRQVLLDGPMTLFATVALYAIASYAITGVRTWLYAAGAAMGLTFLSKETGIVLFGAVYTLFALAPEIRVRLRDLALSIVAFVAVVASFPLALVLAGGGGQTSAQQYLVWQLFRRPNHDADFYMTVVPPAVGLLVMLAAGAGILLAGRRVDWRERLLLAWIAVVVAFFQLWPVKGFQYLLPAAIPLVVLAGRGLVALGRLPGERFDRALRARLGSLGVVATLVGPGARTTVLAAVVAGSLLVTSWPLVQPSRSPQLLAGAGGVPGGREAGTWIRDNTPTGSQLLTVGPSMANIIRFYGNRRVFGLSVSPNPLRRNPSYDPVDNPDLQIRANELQYIVWDSYSATRSPFFGAKLLDYVDRYHGRMVHSETVPGPDGEPVPVIVIYEVRR